MLIYSYFLTANPTRKLLHCTVYYIIFSLTIMTQIKFYAELEIHYKNIRIVCFDKMHILCIYVFLWRI